MVPHKYDKEKVLRLAPLVRRFRPGLRPSGCGVEFDLWWNLSPLAYAVSVVLTKEHALFAAVKKAEKDDSLAAQVWEAVERMPYELVERLAHTVEHQRGLWELKEFLGDD